MLRFSGILLALLAFTSMLCLSALPASAEKWMKIPGRIEFISNNGSIKSYHFTSWATNKPTFLPTVRKPDSRLAGYFLYEDDSQRRTAHVTDVKSIRLQGNGNPIVITFFDGHKDEVEVVNSFIWTISRMKDFHFMAKEREGAAEVPMSVPSEAIKRLFFWEPPQESQAQ